MIPIKQRRRHNPEKGEYGDCSTAALASILELPYEDVPDFAFSETQRDDIRAWLKSIGRDLIWFVWNGDFPLSEIQERMKLWNPDVYYFLLGNSSNDVCHVVVCLNGEIVHDPSLDNSGIVGPSEHDGESVYFTEFIVDSVTLNRGEK